MEFTDSIQVKEKTLYPGGCMHATCIPGTPDHASALIRINNLNSFYDQLSIEIMRLMAPGQTARRRNKACQTRCPRVMLSRHSLSLKNSYS